MMAPFVVATFSSIVVFIHVQCTHQLSAFKNNNDNSHFVDFSADHLLVRYYSDYSFNNGVGFGVDNGNYNPYNNISPRLPQQPSGGSSHRINPPNSWQLRQSQESPWNAFNNPRPTIQPKPTSPTISVAVSTRQCGGRYYSDDARMGGLLLSDDNNTTAEDNSSSGSGYYYETEDKTQAFSSAFDEPEGKIVGGLTAKIEDWPWQVSLRWNDEHKCGGSIIDMWHVVTAAHCLKWSQNVIDWSVYASKSMKKLGEVGEVGPFYVTAIFIHPNYGKSKVHDSDIAVVRLEKPFIWSEKVSPVCLPPRRMVFPENTNCVISGYGETQGTGGQDNLKMAMVPIVSLVQCSSVNENLKKLLTNNMVCAGDYDEGGVDSCQGDSGGPLVCEKDGRFYLYGIVSFGIGCAAKHSPGVYARTGNFHLWIKSKLSAPSTQT